MQVAQHYVRPQLADLRQRQLRTVRFPYDLDVGLRAQNQAEPGTHQRVVIDDEYPDPHHGAPWSDGHKVAPHPVPAKQDLPE